jgi:hypothetical protein
MDLEFAQAGGNPSGVPVSPLDISPVSPNFSPEPGAPNPRGRCPMKQTRRLGWSTCALVAALAGCDPRTELTDIVPTLALSSTSLSPTGTIAGPAVTETVTIVNGTDGTLENLSAQVQYQGPAGWLVVSLDRTTATRDQPATARSGRHRCPAAGNLRRCGRLASPGAGNDGLTIAVRFTVDPRPP